jgi:hypothetical protein
VVEGRIELGDVLVRDALGVEIGFQNGVGGARIDGVGAEQEEALAALPNEIVDGGDRRLLRRGSRVSASRRR